MRMRRAMRPGIRPGNGCRNDAVLRTLDAGRRIPQIDKHVSPVESAPGSRRTTAAVVARTVFPALRAQMLQALIRPHIDHQDPFLIGAESEFAVLYDDVLEIQNVLSSLAVRSMGCPGSP